MANPPYRLPRLPKARMITREISCENSPRLTVRCVMTRINYVRIVGRRVTDVGSAQLNVYTAPTLFVVCVEEVSPSFY
jgi:hypothetical protein